MQSIDVIFHTNTQLDKDQFDAVAKQIYQIPGVVEFKQLPNKPKFILAAYHASETKALSILNKITRLGFQARIIEI